MKKAFTLIELIFTIVIIGVLAAVAVPKFAGLSDNSKIAAELATASSVQVALDSCHGEWIINDDKFTCGGSIESNDPIYFDNDKGYPKKLGDTYPLDKILKNAGAIGWKLSNTNQYRGPASDTTEGTTKCKDGKPCIGKYWEYDKAAGTFTLSP